MRDAFTGGSETVVGSVAGTTQSLTVGNGFAPPPPPEQSFAAFLGGSSLAPDEITPEIEALTRSVTNGQGSGTALEKCFLFVTNQLEYEHYYGCKKGAVLTYMERKGNDADLSTLLVAMLRHAGYTVRYGYGFVRYYTAGQADGIHMQDWLGTSIAAIGNYTSNRGFPAIYSDGGNQRYLPRVWVEVQNGANWVTLDPAVKKRVRITPAADVASWLTTNYSRAALKSAAGGAIGTSYIDGINYSGLSTYLAGRSTALVSYLEANHHGTDAATLLGGWRQEPFLIAGGSQYFFPGDILLALPPYWDAQQSFNALPDWLLTKLKLEVRTVPGNTLVATHEMPMANLQGRRLSLTFTAQDATGKAQLWLDDAILSQETTNAVGTAVKLKIDINHPHGGTANPTLHDQFTEKNYLRGARYALVYGFNPTQEVLRARQDQLDTYRRTLGDTSREVVTETLNVIGLTWLHQTELLERAIGGKTNCDTTYHHRLGRVSQESGYYIDVETQFDSVFSLDGNTALQNQASDAVDYFASAMEHGVIEQMQGADNPSVSTVKLLKLSNEQAAGFRKTYYANSTATWNAIRPTLASTYSAADLAKLDDAIAQGGEILAPQKGNINLNQWTGAGYITRVTTAASRTTGMLISGALNGGYASIARPISTPTVTNFTNSNPIRVNTTPITIQPTLSFDPIDLGSGDYVFPATDLEVGAPAPRGFTFSRQYHGGRRWVNPAGLGYGWTHNWHVRATRRSAYESAFGLSGTPYDIASALVAVHAALDLNSATADAQHWALSSLVANWLSDQLLDNAVSISIGERSMQFTHRADGNWQAPPGVTMSLTTLTHGVTGAFLGWQAQERHGNRYNFNDTGKLTSVVDLWNKTLNVTYDGDKVSTVTDAYGRSMTFNYNTAGTKLDSVNDSTGRTVNFSYTGNDLTTASDAEGKADRFAYDTEHRITHVRNHDQELIAINVYDAAGKVIEQLSHGDANRTWRYYYSFASAVEENPEGGKTTYFFDQRKRQVGKLDAIGRYSSTTYDGQDRVTETRTPLGLTTVRTYDRFHNLRTLRDPDNKTTTFDFDAANDLRTITDALNHTKNFTYNSYHQPLTVRNHYSQGVTHAYNGSTGTLTSTTDDASNQTGYGYNARDELTTTTLPGTGTDRTETIVRTIRGDPDSVTDRRNNVTSYTYNNRRQVLTVTRPGLPAVVNIYNNQRQLASTTDARGKTTNYTTYSPTGKLLITTLPGGATVTNAYDSRDWQESTTNPKLPTETAQTTTFSYASSGELLEQYDPLNRLTYFGYDLDSRKTLVGDALFHEVETGYNGRGLVTSNVDQLEKGSSNDYDNAGRRTQFTNRRSQPFIFGHDDADRLLSTKTPNLRINSQTWNARGLVDTMTEPSTQGTTLGHDARGRLQTRSDGVGTVTYSYDGNDNLLTVTQGAATITRTYDTLNRVETYDDGRGHTLGYGYDNNGNLTTLTYEPGKAVTYVYDDRNRLTEIHDWIGRATYLTYDGPGRLLTTTRPNGTVRTNTWDAAGQLKNVMDKHTASGKPVLALKLDYDLAGRLKNKFEVPSWGNLPALPARTVTYNNDNQLATFNGQTIVHDLDGNTTSAPLPNGTSTLQSYGWNARNQLTSAPGGYTFAYDAEGLRTNYTQSAQTTTFVNDPHGPMSRVLIRIRPDGTRTFYVYGPVLLYEIEETGNVARYYHYDHLGSTIALSDDAGKSMARANYSAYGITIQTSGTLDTPFLWQGAFGVQTDPNGLHHMRARYYHAYMGRFLSEDPLGLAAGPNVYAYADGNPIGLIDPLGLATANPNTTFKSIFDFSMMKTTWDGFNRTGDKIANAVSSIMKPIAEATNKLQQSGAFISIEVMYGGGAPKAPLWTSTKSKTAVENAFAHWKKHGAEFSQIQNAKQYIESAKGFFSNPPAGTLTKVRSNGEKVFYNPTSNTFGVQAADGAPKTMFQPDPLKHGYPSNLDYFNAQ